MAKISLAVTLERVEVDKLITDYALEKAGRPQGSSKVVYVFASSKGFDGEMESATVTFNGVVPKP